MANKKSSSSKSTTKKTPKKTAAKKAQVDNFQPTSMSLAVSALAATTLVLLALVATM